MSKGHGRLNWANRQSPGEFDETAPPPKPTYEFDLRRDTSPGAKSSWPERLQGERFGPTFIGRAWKAGLVVVAKIEGLPHPVAAVETKWSSGILVIKTAEGWRTPERIWTRKTVRGLSSCGELLREEE